MNAMNAMNECIGGVMDECIGGGMNECISGVRYGRVISTESEFHFI